MNNNFVRVNIKGAVLDQVSDMPYILLNTEDKKYTIPISVGPAEATAVIMALEGIKTTRPLTHDLFVHFISMHGFKILRIEIYDLINTKFYSKLLYKKGFRQFKIELRPSDGLALAVRLGTPIFINPEICEEASGIMKMYESDRHFKQDNVRFDVKMYDEY
ncbi:MAG: bifunctional nuclease family protein [Spirochaetales bacterium]|nr:bifunctional nuclease family protein [Spirochaetales bacterium]